MPKKRVWKAKLAEGFHPVAIDMDVHKAIEAARRDFAEMPNAILRRLLRIDEHVPAAPAAPRAAAARGRAKGGGAGAGGWSKIGRDGRHIELPDGTELRAAYAGRTVTGRIGGGGWHVGAGVYNSPSAALIANVTTRDGRPAVLNGWRHWEVRRPGETGWTPLAEA